eukprot:10453858-Lingulodinium_polyedra.AAC.1
MPGDSAVGVSKDARAQQMFKHCRCLEHFKCFACFTCVIVSHASCGSNAPNVWKCCSIAVAA